MKSILLGLKSALVTGLLIVLPAWLALLLFFKVLVQLGVLVKPVASHMPEGINHTKVIAFLVFLLICLVVGILFHTTLGRRIGAMLGENIFSHIPGYQSLRSIARQFTDVDAKEGFKPALIEVEDGCLAPAFIIEIHDNGQSTVFLPSVPTPMAGSLFIMPSDRVHPVDVPVTTMMKCITKWGAGSGRLLAALPGRSS